MCVRLNLAPHMIKHTRIHMVNDLGSRKKEGERKIVPRCHMHLVIENLQHILSALSSNVRAQGGQSPYGLSVFSRTTTTINIYILLLLHLVSDHAVMCETSAK